MNLPRLVLLLTVLMPLLGWAQEASDAPTAPAPEKGRLSAPPLVSAPAAETEPGRSPYEPGDLRLLDEEARRALEAEEEYGGTFGRVMFETLGSVAGGVAGGLAGYGAAQYFGGDIEPYLVVTGVLMGTTLGVYGAGTLMSARGGVLPTLLGSVAGMGMSFLVLGMNDGLGDGGLELIPLVLMPLVGPIVGYEVSHSLEMESTAGLRARAGPRVYPVLGATARGRPALGLAGSF
jgi:hypothetical protein